MKIEINIANLLPEHLQAKVIDSFYNEYVLKHLFLFLSGIHGLETLFNDNLDSTILLSFKFVIFHSRTAIEVLKKSYKSYLKMVSLNFHCNAMKQYEQLSNGINAIKYITETKDSRIISDLVEKQYLYSEYFNDCSDLKIVYGGFMEQLMGTTIYLIPMRHILVLLLHNLLKSSIDENEFNTYAASYLQMYYWVEDKDIFYKEFSSSLEILLLSTSTEGIELLINRIKVLLAKMSENAGVAYTASMSSLITEIEESAKFTSICVQNYKSKIQYGIKVVPNQAFAIPKCILSLPSCVELLSSDICKLYSQSYKSKTLTWQNSLSTFVIEYTPKKILFKCSLEQTIVMMLFNTTNSINLLTVPSIMGLSTLQIINVLNQLESISLIIKAADEWVINPSFTLKSHIIDLVEQMPKLIYNCNEVNITERMQCIEAAIIKVLKNKKSLSFDDIAQSVRDYITLFIPTKEQIENSMKKVVSNEFATIDIESGNYVYIP